MEEENTVNEGISADKVDGLEFFLFLILLLILMGSQNTLSSHFNLLDKEVNKISNFLNMFSTTATGLKTLMETPKFQ